MCKSVVLAALIVATSCVASPEQREQLLSYPDTILHNAKILTMDRDDDSATVAQAIAIKDGRIVAVGTNEAVLRLAGPRTDRRDLGGRTVIPGVIDTHAHLTEYATEYVQLPGDRDQVPGRTWTDVRATALAKIADQERSRPAGDWLGVSLPSGAEDTDGKPLDVKVALVRGLITKVDLDKVAPTHPVLIQGGTRTVFNTRALEAMRAFYGGLDEEIRPEDGVAESVEIRRAITIDILVQDERQLVDAFRREMDKWLGQGVTTMSTSLSALRDLGLLRTMERSDNFPIRLAYSHAQGITSSSTGPDFYRHFGDAVGLGSDHLWLIGASVVSGDGSYPQQATTLQAPATIKSRELTRLAPGVYRRRVIDAIAGAGLRISGTHIAGDKTLDDLMDAIEAAAKARGLTSDQLKAMRNASDHCALNPRPEQFGRIKRLGMYMSCSTKYLDIAPQVDADYGPAAVRYNVPVKSMLDAGVKVVYESDVNDFERNGAFYLIERLVTRADRNGKVWSPQDRVDRMTALRMATRWAAEYVLREKDLGSLEVGKWADLVVLDRDYATIPENQIHTLNVVETRVAGRVVYPR